MILTLERPGTECQPFRRSTYVSAVSSYKSLCFSSAVSSFVFVSSPECATAAVIAPTQLLLPAGRTPCCAETRRSLSKAHPRLLKPQNRASMKNLRRHSSGSRAAFKPSSTLSAFGRQRRAKLRLPPPPAPVSPRPTPSRPLRGSGGLERRHRSGPWSTPPALASPRR